MPNTTYQSSYTGAQIDAAINTIPTKTSDLTNDSGFITSVPSASSITPNNLGTASPGISNDYARADHVHNMPITYYDYEFTNVSITSGTIGTRGAQLSITLPSSLNNQHILAVFPIYIGNSSEYLVSPFYTDGKIYCNFYRAASSASLGAATIRAVFTNI